MPVVIYLHGGAWSHGNKDLILNNYREYVLQELLRNQYTVISVDYTLLNKSTHIDKPLQDIRDALDWIRINADKYGLDVHNVGIWGGSAGGHLALLTAYNTEKKLPIPIKYVIDCFAPTDLRKLFRTDGNYFLMKFFNLYNKKDYALRKNKIMELTGFDIDSNQKQAHESCIRFSPINYVNKKTVPTFILHGTEDKIVDISQSKLLDEVLDENGVYHQFYTINRARHSFSNIM